MVREGSTFRTKNRGIALAWLSPGTSNGCQISAGTGVIVRASQPQSGFNTGMRPAGGALEFDLAICDAV